jgi:hypothetical protein
MERVVEKEFAIRLAGPSGSDTRMIARLLERQFQERGLQVDLLGEPMTPTDVIGDTTPASAPVAREVVAWIMDGILTSPGAREKPKRPVENVVEIVVHFPQEDSLGGGALSAGRLNRFEQSTSAEVLVEIDQVSVEEGAWKILAALEQGGQIPRAPSSEMVYSDEEEAAVRQRLQDLGYI